MKTKQQELADRLDAHVLGNDRTAFHDDLRYTEGLPLTISWPLTKEIFGTPAPDGTYPGFDWKRYERLVGDLRGGGSRE